MTKIIFTILDGFGYREEKHGNAILNANIPNLKNIWANYPHSLLTASGKKVGLPEGQMGNSEVGHLNIGAGRIVYQPLEKINKSIEDKERLQWFAAKHANAKDIFFIGRGIDYAVCLEGSLKLKEISYIHSEAYAAGELKHGPISLIEDGTVVFSVVTQSALYEKTISNMPV